MGRPVSTGSVKHSNGGHRAYLHIKRLRRIAAKVGGVDGQLLEAAADAMQAVARHNQVLGRKVGRTVQRAALGGRGASFPIKEAAEAICDLAADGPVVAFQWRTKSRIRVTRGTPQSGARIVGRFDISSDYRAVEEAVRRVA